MYFPQFSTTAPSAPQTGHSASIASAVQASSQAQTGASGGVVASVDPSCSGATYLQQSSTAAPSAPQTGHSVFMASAMQEFSQLHTAASDSAASGSAPSDSTVSESAVSEPVDSEPLSSGSAASDCVAASADSSFIASAYLEQFSIPAPSAPQTEHSASISSAVQASSQVHTGVSAFSSANAAAGSKDSTMHSAIARLKNLFFIIIFPFSPQLRRGHTFQ